MRITLLAGTLLLGALTFQDPEKETAPPVEVGKPAPAFRLNDHTGKLVAVGGDNANWTVLAFYPKSATPG